MTDLQASLMAIGGTIVVGVISYNKWQEYKSKKSVERAFPSEHEDVLMTPDATASTVPHQRHEPTLGNDSEAVQVSQPSQTAEATLQEHAAFIEPPAQTKAAVPQKELPVDELIDCIIPLSLEAPIRGEKLLPKLQTLRHVGNKAIHFIGQVDDGVWEPIVHAGIYYGLRAGVQMANRSSALNEIEYSELIMSLRHIADEIDAELDVPDMMQVMGTARALHQFVVEHDAQLSINVRSTGSPWAINALLAALERQGFDLRPDGRLVMPDGDGGILYSLSTNATLTEETTSRLTLLLDVPRVAALRDGFGAAAACAKVLASRLGGVVVDDGNQPLTDAALAEIAGQVNEFYGHMAEANVPAGSSRALRLFS